MATFDEAIQHLENGDWDAAHHIVQADSSQLGSWAHGIVHTMEGDLGNARYWYSRAGQPESTKSVKEERVDLIRHFLGN